MSFPQAVPQHWPLLALELPPPIYQKVALRAWRYALLSLPFTVDRLGLTGQKKQTHALQLRLANVFKGKLAEALLEAFAQKNNLGFDFAACATPFYRSDHRDFIYRGSAFDIKNNFIYYAGGHFEAYRMLPALIPDRFRGDQWDRSSRPFRGMPSAWLFSFIQAGPMLEGKKRGQAFWEIKLNAAQQDLLLKLIHRFAKQPERKKPPFRARDFWRAWLQRGNSMGFRLRNKPSLVLCAVAGQRERALFFRTGAGTPPHPQSPCENWYRKKGPRASLSFLNETLWTTITNRCTAVQNLQALPEAFPELGPQPHWGKWIFEKSADTGDYR